MMAVDRYKYDHGGEENKSESSGSETARREKEGATYCRRDKTGSASEWFSHEHTGDDGQKQQGKTVGSVNAARMRNESDCWFNYDKAATEETAVIHKKRGAAVKPDGNEMHGVFHHAAADN